MTREDREISIKAASMEVGAFAALMEEIKELREHGITHCVTPDITNDARNFNAGRAASMIDLIGIVEKIRE